VRPSRIAALTLTVAALVVSAAPARAQSGDGDVPPPQAFDVVSALPPGQSGFFSVEGQARGQASGGDPGAYGEHVDDQRQLFWDFDYKPGGFAPPTGPVETPQPGVRIYRDAFGVPQIYGDTGRDVWFGAGYAAAQDRLFLMDAVRRTGEGTLAELTGPGDVPADVATRVLTYTDAEYEAMFDRLSPMARDAIEGYVDGANAWRAKVLTDPRLLPAEYVLLSSVPEEFTVRGVLAGGVYITRYVAAEGGKEMSSVAALRELQQALGQEVGAATFADLVWLDEPEAAVTVPAEEGRFRNPATTDAQRRAAFEAAVGHAATIPLELADGVGTGAHPVPATPSGVGPPTGSPKRRADVARAARSVGAALRALKGGSIAFAVAPAATGGQGAALLSGPQLPYSYPSLLWELEIHGGGYDARGVSVPGLPTIGIGYGERTAWALTSGYSKTIDSYIETTRPTDGDPEYQHDGTWRPMDCRDETVRYRAAPEGVPVGPPVFTETVRACRTVHGPVVSTTEDRTRARSLQYAMWGRDLDTIEGILDWNRVDDLASFTRAVAKVTWNENVLYADADGNIAYWHPGLHPRRAPSADPRLPLRGTGEDDPDGFLPFEQLPHAVNPARGYLANWNNQPAAEWTPNEGIGDTSRPGSPVQRVRLLHELLPGRRGLTMAGVQQVDRDAGTLDVRRHLYLPALRAAAREPALAPTSRAVLDAVLAWDGRHLDPATDMSEPVSDSPGATAFDAVVRALRAEVAKAVPSAALVARQSAVGSHRFDSSPFDSLTARAIDAEAPGRPLSRDYLGGRTPRQVVLAAVAAAGEQLTSEFGAEPESWRRMHPRTEVCSLTGGVIGPCTDMPYQDRGTWVHLVSFRSAPARPGPRPLPPPRPLPATGLPAALPFLALAGLAGAAKLARRPHAPLAECRRDRRPS
jgi:penicillin G amidase